MRMARRVLLDRWGAQDRVRVVGSTGGAHKTGFELLVRPVKRTRPLRATYGSLVIVVFGIAEDAGATGTETCT
jgi:hypothetical protein